MRPVKLYPTDDSYTTIRRCVTPLLLRVWGQDCYVPESIFSLMVESNYYDGVCNYVSSNAVD